MGSKGIGQVLCDVKFDLLRSGVAVPIKCSGVWLRRIALHFLVSKFLGDR